MSMAQEIQQEDKPLKPQHELFAELMANGDITAGKAYSIVYPNAKASTAETTGPELLRKPQIRLRVDRLMAERAEKAEISKVEVLKFLADAIRTPVGEIDESHPLAQDVIITTGKGWAKTQVKSVSKLGAVQEISKLCGFYEPEKLQVLGILQLIEDDGTRV